MQCRNNCAACCTAPSISSPLPGMPKGKPAGVTCVNLNPETLRCSVWGTPQYPKVCESFQASEENCGTERDEAIRILTELEQLTRPN